MNTTIFMKPNTILIFTCPDILANDQVKLRLQIKETLRIKEQTAYKFLNQNTGSFPLMLW